MNQKGYQIRHEVKLWSVDILKHFRSTISSTFTVKEVVEHFNITSKEAYKRVNRLRQWGLVRIKSRKKPKIYEITSWGYKFQPKERR